MSTLEHVTPTPLPQFESGDYVFAKQPDEFGARAFMVVEIQWEELSMTYLNDAASNWGLAPWSMLPVTPEMGIYPLGSWESILLDHHQSISLITQAAQDFEFKDNPPSALLTLRSALCLETENKMTLDLALLYLKKERSLDEERQMSKKEAFLLENPAWELSS